MNVLAFNRWDCSGLEVEDPGLKAYIQTKPVIVPKTGARYAGQRFHKSRIFIVERLINKVMVVGHKGKKHTFTSGHNTGKATKAFDLVEEALSIVEERTGENPVKVLIKAIENAAPREEIITIEYGGARYPKPVEMAPQRRVDFALRMIAQGAFQKAFNKKKRASQSLAEEIIAAFKLSPHSVAIAKKYELERQADSSR